jgi:hypothetical protein
MKAPLLLATASLLALLLALLAVVAQRGAAHDLRQEIATLTATLTAPVPAAEAPVRPESAPLTEAERLELLRLRGQITRLRGEARGLAAAEAEHAALQQRLAAAKANPASIGAALPPGYILRRTARNAGQATPEATVETFLWAIEHRDVNTLLQTLTPADAQKLSEGLQRQGEDFWQGAAKLPGMRVSDQKPLADGSVELKLSIELEGTADQQTTKARLVDGRWRIEMR